jgi:hypothetical protein
MWPRPIAVTMLLMVGVVPGRSATDTDVLKQFGMLGRWAIDCKQPPGPTNPYLIFAASGSGATRALKTGDPKRDATFPVRAVKILDVSRIQMETDNNDKTITTVVVVQKSGNTIQTIRSEGNGRVFIQDGRFIENNQAATPTFTRCSAQ